MRAQGERPGPPRFSRLIGLSFASKLFADTLTQIFDPFLPLIASGLGIDIVMLGRWVALRSAMGLLVPLIGVQAERWGTQRTLRAALLVSALGTLVMGLSGPLWTVSLAVVLMGIGGSTFVPMLHAYLSGHLPYPRRARGLGMVEYSWAFAAIVGLSLMGLAISAYGWRSPFLILSGGQVLAWAMLGRLPRLEDAPEASSAPRESAFALRQALRTHLTLGEDSRSAWAAIGATGLLFLATTHVQISYGSWLHGEYHLDASRLGTAALAIGCAMLVGSVSVSLISDRIGKRRSVLIGLIAMIAANLALVAFDAGPIWAVAGVMLTFICFEFTIVSNIPLLSELLPHRRATLLSLSTASALIGRSLGSVSGPSAYTAFGIWGLGPFSAAVAALALFIFWRFVREAPAGPADP